MKTKTGILHTFILAILSLLCLPAMAQNRSYQYESVPNDPLGVKIYTLQNGMKVYMSVYKDVPKIQTYIIVRAGSKNDPAETTGLAHYLEHLMFKGTASFGTANWEAEAPLLDRIEALFEDYRRATDPQERAGIYHLIDSLSYLASGYAIPNEYVKLMKFLGSTGTNAWTSNDNTVYLEQIPSNQLANWAMIQSDRFQNPVIRLFHTELETIYEEKNRSLTNDSRRANEAMLAQLFPNHPYGTQTTLGEAEHLRNPSITNIKNFIRTHYVPNNMAICLAGDFDPDEAIALIEQHFGNMQPQPLPPRDLTTAPTQPLTGVKTVEVAGNEAEFVSIAFPLNLPANANELYIARMLDHVLSNGKSGLIDLNINQKQLLSSASAYPYILCDNSAFILTGKPRKGQSLDDVAELLLEQLTLVREGNFDDGLLTAALNNIRLQEMRQLESNSSRASKMANAFMNDIPWSEVCAGMDLYARITKQDIIDFANRYLPADRYIVVRKVKGKPAGIETVRKPAITPIQINRDGESEFFRKLKEIHVPPIEPVFADYKKEIKHFTFQKSEVYCLENTENQTFDLRIIFPIGEMTDNRLPIVAAYSNYIATAAHTSEQLKREFYKLACSFSASCSDDNFTVRLTGLADNFGPALRLVTEMLTQADVSDPTSFDQMIETRIKNMHDAKNSQEAVLAALRVYGEYGSALVGYSLTPDQLENLDFKEVGSLWKSLTQYLPEITYYGPLSTSKLKKALASNLYKIPTQPKAPTDIQRFDRQSVTENTVLFVPYDAKQARLVTYSNGPHFEAQLIPIITMYNTYFGGGMSAIVFQEMREKRSLAYTARSAFNLPTVKDDICYNYSFIGTQNDKVVDAWEAFDTLFNEMPLSESAFQLAKENLKSTIATTRYTKTALLNAFITHRKLGFTYDYRRDVYRAIDGLSLADIAEFNAQHIKNRPKVYMLLARESDIDFQILESQFGKVRKLTLKDVFGY